VAEEAEPERRGGLIQPAGEHEVGDGCVENPRRVVVRHGERPSTAGENRLQYVRGLDGGLVDSAVPQEDEFDRPGSPVGHDDHEALAVAVEQLGPHDIRDGLLVDQPGPRRGCTGSPPDLGNRDQPPCRGRPDARKVLQASEVHRRQAGEPAGAPEDGARQRQHAAPRLPRSQHQRQDLVIGERSDAQSSHAFSRAVVMGDVRKCLTLFFLVGHGSTLERDAP